MLATYHQIRSSSKVCYFLIKSFQADHIRLSQRHSVWATTGRNERTLATAVESHEFVVLIYSVNASGKFYGYAIVTSLAPPTTAPPVFIGNDGRTFPGRPFGVRWLSTLELPFKHFDHIVNAYNDNKPVKVGRDGQPVSNEAGGQVLQVYQNMEEQLAGPQQQQSQPASQQATPALVAGGWMIPSSDNVVDWPTTVLSINPLLSIYPIDLTKFTYQSYCDLYNASVDYVTSKEAIAPPFKGYVDWSTPEHAAHLEQLLAEGAEGSAP